MRSDCLARRGYTTLDFIAHKFLRFFFAAEPASAACDIANIARRLERRFETRQSSAGIYCRLRLYTLIGH